MNKESSIINWSEIMDKFTKHEGNIIDFCRSSNIKPHQFYHQRKKLKKNSTQVFHVLEVPKADSIENTKELEETIKIEIGNAKIFLPANDKSTLLSLVRELAKLC
ncbi:MAG: hypothetical protein H7Y18_03115 [Clostridiaceae bacterium]|nr:hypothetical protein [Clostridiaceae bacterium]